MYIRFKKISIAIFAYGNRHRSSRRGFFARNQDYPSKIYIILTSLLLYMPIRKLIPMGQTSKGITIPHEYLERHKDIEYFSLKVIKDEILVKPIEGSHGE